MEASRCPTRPGEKTFTKGKLARKASPLVCTNLRKILIARVRGSVSFGSMGEKVGLAAGNIGSGKARGSNTFVHLDVDMKACHTSTVSGLTCNKIRITMSMSYDDVSLFKEKTPALMPYVDVQQCVKTDREVKRMPHRAAFRVHGHFAAVPQGIYDMLSEHNVSKCFFDAYFYDPVPPLCELEFSFRQIGTRLDHAWGVMHTDINPRSATPVPGSSVSCDFDDEQSPVEIEKSIHSTVHICIRTPLSRRPIYIIACVFQEEEEISAHVSWHAFESNLMSLSATKFFRNQNYSNISTNRFRRELAIASEHARVRLAIESGHETEALTIGIADNILRLKMKDEVVSDTKHVELIRAWIKEQTSEEYAGLSTDFTYVMAKRSETFEEEREILRGYFSSVEYDCEQNKPKIITDIVKRLKSKDSQWERALIALEFLKSLTRVHDAAFKARGTRGYSSARTVKGLHVPVKWLRISSEHLAHFSLEVNNVKCIPETEKDMTESRFKNAFNVGLVGERHRGKLETDVATFITKGGIIVQFKEDYFDLDSEPSRDEFVRIKEDDIIVPICSEGQNRSMVAYMHLMSLKGALGSTSVMPAFGAEGCGDLQWRLPASNLEWQYFSPVNDASFDKTANGRGHRSMYGTSKPRRTGDMFNRFELVGHLGDAREVLSRTKTAFERSLFSQREPGEVLGETSRRKVFVVFDRNVAYLLKRINEATKGKDLKNVLVVHAPFGDGVNQTDKVIPMLNKLQLRSAYEYAPLNKSNSPGKTAVVGKMFYEKVAALFKVSPIVRLSHGHRFRPPTPTGKLLRLTSVKKRGFGLGMTGNGSEVEGGRRQQIPEHEWKSILIRGGIPVIDSPSELPEKTPMADGELVYHTKTEINGKEESITISLIDMRDMLGVLNEHTVRQRISDVKHDYVLKFFGVMFIGDKVGIVRERWAKLPTYGMHATEMRDQNWRALKEQVHVLHQNFVFLSGSSYDVIAIRSSDSTIVVGNLTECTIAPSVSAKGILSRGRSRMRGRRVRSGDEKYQQYLSEARLVRYQECRKAVQEEDIATKMEHLKRFALNHNAPWLIAPEMVLALVEGGWDYRTNTHAYSDTWLLKRLLEVVMSRRDSIVEEIKHVKEDTSHPDLTLNGEIVRYKNRKNVKLLAFPDGNTDDGIPLSAFSWLREDGDGVSESKGDGAVPDVNVQVGERCVLRSGIIGTVKSVLKSHDGEKLMGVVTLSREKYKFAARFDFVVVTEKVKKMGKTQVYDAEMIPGKRLGAGFPQIELRDLDGHQEKISLFDFMDPRHDFMNIRNLKTLRRSVAEKEEKREEVVPCTQITVDTKYSLPLQVELMHEDSDVE